MNLKFFWCTNFRLKKLYLRTKEVALNVLQCVLFFTVFLIILHLLIQFLPFLRECFTRVLHFLYIAIYWMAADFPFSRKEFVLAWAEYSQWKFKYNNFWSPWSSVGGNTGVEITTLEWRLQHWSGDYNTGVEITTLEWRLQHWSGDYNTGVEIRTLEWRLEHWSGD